MNEYTMSNNRILVAMFLEIPVGLADRIRGDTLVEMAKDGCEWKSTFAGDLFARPVCELGKAPTEFNENCLKSFQKRFLELANDHRDYIPDKEIRELAALRVGLSATMARWVMGDTVVDMMRDADDLLADCCEAAHMTKPAWNEPAPLGSTEHPGPYDHMTPACRDFAERFEQAAQQGFGWTDANGEQHWTRLY